MDNSAFVFPMTAAIGAFLLLALIMLGWFRSRSQNERVDPTRSSDDPSKGVPGAGGATGPRPRLHPGLIAALCVALAAVVGGFVFANGHLAAKGPGDLPTTQEVATGTTAPARDAYNASDFVEPNAK